MIDWQLVANMLRRHAPLAEIERQIGMARGSLNRIARGEADEPKFSTGMALLDYAHDVLPPDQFERARIE